MQTEAVRNASFLELAEEDDVPAHFLDCYMEVPDSRIYVFQVVQFVIMRREEGLRTVAVFMDILDYGTGNGHAVIGRGSSAYLVEEHQRTGRYVVQDHRCLEHLDHECRLSTGDVVRRSDTGEYLVAVAQSGLSRRDIASDLRHQHDERRLAQKG